MIIARTPFRLSFFGGGTDYPAWYKREGGAVLSTTIDKYCYLTVRYLPPFFPTKHRVVWSHVETVGSVAEILHPAVREGMRFLGFDDGAGLEIHHQGDLPARAGMGSSSAFAVGLIQALTALRGQMIGRRELARQAIALEQEWMGDSVGSQDQVAAAYGGLNRIEFQPSGEIAVDPVTVARARVEALQDHLLLFYTGTSRLASEVAADVVANLGAKQAVLRRMRAMVDEGIAILCGDGTLDAFGALLHEAWTLKRELSGRIASPTVEEVYQQAIRNGALGGKLLGAGGSGFMVFYVPQRRREAVLRALANYLHVPFAFESEGSRIIYYGPQSVRLETARPATAVTRTASRRGGRGEQTHARVGVAG
jgi:D-glycero-alpha-D-manno-heptose-7-phosphate kinase